MKRKKQILLCFLIVGVLGFAHIRVQELFFSPEGVYQAYEKGHHRESYGGIVLEYETETGKMLVGRQPDGLIFTPVEKKGLLWTLQEKGTSGLWTLQEEIGGIIVDGKHFVGLCRNSEIAEVACVYGKWNDEGVWKLRKSSGQVDENGIVCFEIDLPENEPADYFLEGRNADGEVLYTMGDGGLAESLRSGSFALKAKDATKPFITAPDIE